MAVTLNERNGGKMLEVQVSEKLTHDDYQHFVPAFERLVKEHGKVRVLFRCRIFTAGTRARCGPTSSSI